MKNALYANANERVNSISIFLEKDQRAWYENIADIECALRSSIHSSTGVSPYFALFGHNMVTHASAYEVLRKKPWLKSRIVKVYMK